MDEKEQDKICVDCNEGKRMGCQTFCCSLLVQLHPEEMEPTVDGSTAKGYVDKTPDGICVHMDQNLGLCNIWGERPHTCRAYDCNSDFLMQIVLRKGFVNIAKTAIAASKVFIPKESYIKIPLLKPLLKPSLKEAFVKRRPSP